MDAVSLTVGVAVTLLTLTATVLLAVVRIVPVGHVGVVTRGSVVLRTRPSGVFVAIPRLDRLVMVPIGAQNLEPLRVMAVTRDGVELQLVLSVLWRVVEPAVAVHVIPPGGRTNAAELVERAVHHLVARVDLVDLLRDRDCLLAKLTDAGRSLLTAAGVEVLDADLLDAEVRVGPELIRLLT